MNADCLLKNKMSTKHFDKSQVQRTFWWVCFFFKQNTIYSFPKQYIGNSFFIYKTEGRSGCDRMIVGFITTYAISAYHQ